MSYVINFYLCVFAVDALLIAGYYLDKRIAKRRRWKRFIKQILQNTN